MTTTIKYSNILLTVLLLALAGCTKDPQIRTTVNLSLGFVNMQDQRALAGESIDVSFWFNAGVDEDFKTDSVRVVFEVLSGGGEAWPTEVYVADDEGATIGWTLGHDSFRQVLRATLYDLTGTRITDRELVACGFRENQWDEVTGTAEVQITDLVADTVNGVTFMTTYNKLYRQGARYYIWEEVTEAVFQQPDSPRAVEIDRNGVIYVSTSGGNIIRSLDHGLTWLPCTKPWPEIGSYIQAYVSNDARLWVYFSGKPLRFSDDRGITWHDAGTTGVTGGISDIFRLSDGTLFMHGLDCCSLSYSGDDGHTWTPVQTPAYSHKLFVNDDDDIFVLSSQGTGEVIFRSADRGLSYTPVHSVAVSYRSAYDNIFNPWGDFYYVAVPGYGIMTSDDLSDFVNHWVFHDLRTLYIDHNGVLMVRTMDFQSLYYMKYSG